MIPHSPSPLPLSGPLCDPPPTPPEPQRVAPPLPEGPELPELRLTLLGAPQVALGATALSFKRRKAVALLAYLALTARQHSREALASLLAAADADDAQAKTQLRNTLYALGPQLSAYLQLTRETIGLHPARPLWVDARELQRAVLAASAPGADTRALAQALALHAGAL